MKVTDFSVFLHRFLTDYLPNERGASSNTVDTYRYTFILFIGFLEEEGIKADRFEIKDLNRTLVLDFLEWIEGKGNSISTRNNRLAAVFSFINYLKLEYPDYLDQYIEISAIPLKKNVKTSVDYIETEGIKLIISKTDRKTIKGYRDYMIIFIMYETGVRVSELSNIQLKDFHKAKPHYLKVFGKGNKERLIPLAKEVIDELDGYLSFSNLKNKPLDHLLFFNNRNEPFTRAGIANIIGKYVDAARKENPLLIPEKVSPHTLRHSKAMNLLQCGVNLVYIRDFLGHTSIQTTEIYARANSRIKQEAIESAYQNIYPAEKPEWEDESILHWLKQFS